MILSNQSAQTWRGVLLVFLAYLYFLLFSQFTLLELLRLRLGEGAPLRTVLAAMAASGIAGSLLALRLRSGRVFAPALLACAAAALAAPSASRPLAFAAIAALMGLALGLLTVTVAAMLPLLVPRSLCGRAAGAGTGLAYAVCNLPAVFGATAQVRALGCAATLLGGALVFARMQFPEKAPPQEAGRRRWTPLLFACLVTAFTVLVWFDSAAFYVIQQTRALRSLSWEGPFQLHLNALVHLAAALAAGWMLDASRGRFVLPLAWLGLAAGATGLQWAGQSLFTLPYVAAVSLYSTALVRLPSLHAAVPGDRESFARAAVVYAVGGWIGSGLGIGMAENLGIVPPAFIALSVLVLLPASALAALLK
jgi:cytochrome c oxidase cbb3-type subunit 2